MTENLPQRAERLRMILPQAAAIGTQLIVDNPLQFALVTAGAMVAARTALNIVRPRSPLEAIALLAVLEFSAPFVIRKLIDSGALRFRVRDDNGQLVPLVTGKPATKLLFHGADCPGHTTGKPGASCLADAGLAGA